MGSNDLAILFMGVLVALGGAVLYAVGPSNSAMVLQEGAGANGTLAAFTASASQSYNTWHTGGIALAAVGVVIIAIGAMMELRPSERVAQ
jgi:hypothetical protein